MKKILFIFLLISGFVFGQEKQLYKTVSYNDLISLYNTTLKLNNENLTENIERCKHIIDDAKTKRDNDTYFAFTIFLKGLTDAQTKDKSTAFLSIYKDPTSYNFYDSSDKFVGRIYKEKFDNSLSEKGDNAETYLESYFYLLQE